jgi:hypothetical protein
MIPRIDFQYGQGMINLDEEVRVQKGGFSAPRRLDEARD